MKTKLFLFFIFIFCPLAQGQEKNESFRILFVGDSITTIKDYRSGKPITSTYPNFVIKKTAGKKIKVEVLAKGGMTTKWMLENLKTHLIKNSYDRIYLYGGINDAWNNSVTPKSTMSNIESIIDLAKSHNCEIYILQGYEPIGFMDYTKMPVTRYQKSKRDNIPLINEYIMFQNDLVELTKKRNDFHLIPKINLGNKTHDGIHPNLEGQKIIAEEILKTL